MVGNLRKLRFRDGISQAYLAERIGVSQQAVAKYENEKAEPDIDVLIRIANYFNTSVDYLVGATEIDHRIEKLTEYMLSDEEIELLDEYRKLDEESKELVCRTVKVLGKKQRR